MFLSYRWCKRPPRTAVLRQVVPAAIDSQDTLPAVHRPLGQELRKSLVHRLVVSLPEDEVRGALDLYKNLFLRTDVRIERGSVAFYPRVVFTYNDQRGCRDPRCRRSVPSGVYLTAGRNSVESARRRAPRRSSRIEVGTERFQERLVNTW